MHSGRPGPPSGPAGHRGLAGHPGRLGQIEYHDSRGPGRLHRPARLDAKLWAIPGVRRHQTGDREMRALFPPEALEQVAGVIRPGAGEFRVWLRPRTSPSRSGKHVLAEVGVYRGHKYGTCRACAGQPSAPARRRDHRGGTEEAP